MITSVSILGSSKMSWTVGNSCTVHSKADLVNQAPELLTGQSSERTFQTDIYSLGMVYLFSTVGLDPGACTDRSYLCRLYM
jgi:serine/threonine protein kinase